MMTAEEELARSVGRLSHDVGKYVARTARNLPAEGPIPGALVEMLVADLYRLANERPASSVFADAAVGLDDDAFEETKDRVTLLLADIDALEIDVRRGEPEAVRNAGQLALAVEQELRACAQTIAASSRRSTR
jgi:hypothetical protein